MTITQLQYVVALAHHQHFKRAADACFVTQPTLSMQIQGLEDELGLLLFDRRKKPVTTTEAGQKIVEQAGKTLREFRRICELADESKGELRGTFTIGVIPTIAPFLLPLFVRIFMKKHTQVDLVLAELETEQILQQLRTNELDAGIVAVPLNETDINERHLYHEPFLAFVPEGHRLANEEFILQSELDVDDILLLDQGHCFRNNVLNLCQREPKGNGHGIKLTSGNFQTLVKFSQQGYGMTLLPYLAAQDLDGERKKFIKPFEDPKPTREIGLIYSRTQAKMRMLDELHRCITGHIPKTLRLHQAEHSTRPTR